MKAHISIENKIVGSLALSLVILLGVGIISYRSVQKLSQAGEWVSHTQEVLSELEAGLVLLTDAETSQRAYLLTGDDHFLQDCQATQAKVGSWYATLHDLTLDNSPQQRRLDELAALISQRLALLNNRIELRQKEGLAAAARAVASREGLVLSGQVHDKFSEMRRAEKQLLVEREADLKHYSHLSLLAIMFGSAIACAIGAGALNLLRLNFIRRQTIEDKLRQSEELHRSMIENVKDYGIFLIDPQGLISSWNIGAQRIKGYLPAEIIGKHFSIFYPSEVANCGFPEQELLIARTEGRFEDESWRVRKDGSRFWANVVLTPIWNAEKNLIGYVKISRDMTAQRAARQELEEIWAQLQAILDNTPALVYVQDLAGRFTFVNRKFEQISGQPRKDIIGKTAPEIFPPPQAEAIKREHQQILTREEPIEVEEMIQYPDGLHPHLAIKFPLRNAHGKIFATSGISYDITARKRMEKIHLEFRALFECLPGSYLVLKPDFTIVAASDAYLKDSMTTRTQLLDHNLFDIFPDNPANPTADGVANLRASLHRVQQTGQTDTMAIQRYDVRRSDGQFEERYWSPVNSPVLNPNREVTYIIHRVEDVTSFVLRKRAGGEDDHAARLEKMEAEIFRSSQEVQSANQQLRAANLELESFSYSVSHDLRAPLRHISGFVDLLRKQLVDLGDAKSERYLNIIANAARQMGVLIDDLLVFSRMNRAELHCSKVAQTTLINEAVERLQTDISQRPIQWKIGELPEIEADPSMMLQVWLNLIGNAVKYTRPRNPAEIEIGCQADSNIEYVFYVRDNGVGFDEQYAPKLFGVFQRLHRSEEFEGTGIGLANVRRIITRHGGRTWAEGKTDHGATFFFSVKKNPSLTSSIHS